MQKRSLAAVHHELYTGMKARVKRLLMLAHGYSLPEWLTQKIYDLLRLKEA